MSIVIGIDPGLTGAVAKADSRGDCAIEDLPTLELPGSGLVRRRLDGRGLVQLLRRFVPAGEKPLVLVEQVRAMGGQNNAVQTQFSLGRTLGGIEAVLDALGWEVRMVEPQAWKAEFGLKRKKDEKDAAYKARSLEAARGLYPAAAGTVLKRQRDHNRAEALLIAHHGLRNLT